MCVDYRVFRDTNLRRTAPLHGRWELTWGYYKLCRVSHPKFRCVTYRKHVGISNVRNDVSIASAPHSPTSPNFYADTERIFSILRTSKSWILIYEFSFVRNAIGLDESSANLGRYSACVHGADASQIGGGLEFSPRLSRKEVKRRTLDSVLKQLTTPSREQINRSHQVSFGWLIGRSVRGWVDLY